MSETYNILLRVEGQDRASGPLGSVGSALGRMGEIAGGILASQVFSRIGSEIWNFTSGSIAAASNLSESFNKVQEIFGASFGEISDWSKSAASSVGLSQQAALDAASGFAVFGKAAGLLGSDLVSFGEDNVKLAADMASFFNTSVGDAAQAISSAFRGEMEPIRRYGVLLDDASLRAKALELGIISTTKNALTPQQKVLAAQSLIMQQTSAAQGDFERTSGGLANQQRILAAQIENAQTQLGTFFLPIVTEAMKFLNTTGIGALQGFITNFGFFANDIKDNGIGVAFDDLRESLVGIVPPEVLTLMSNLYDVFENIGNFIQTYILPVFQQVTDWLSAQMLPILSLVNQYWNEFMGAIVGAGVALAGNSIVVALAGIGPAMTAFSVALAAVNWPLVLIVGAIALLGAAWAGNWGDIQGKTAEAWAVIQPLLQQLWDWLATNVPAAWEVLKGAFTDLWAWLSTNIPAAIQTVSDYWNNTLYPAMLYVWSLLDMTVFPLFRELGEFFKTAFSLALTAMAGIWEKVLVPALTSAWDWLTKVGNNIKTALQPAFDALRPVVEKVGNFFKGAFTDALGGILTKIQDVTKWIGDLTGALKNIKLPAWMTPGSPTPWENGLVGVKKALADVSGVSLPGLSASFSALPAPMMAGLAGGVGIGRPSFSGASGSSANNVYVTINTAMNTADETKMRQILDPIVTDINRRNKK